MLSTEIWAFILCYLDHNDVLNVFACSKLFYCLSRKKNEKLVQKLNHSKLIVSNKDMFGKSYDLLVFNFLINFKNTLIRIQCLLSKKKKKKKCLILFLKCFLFVFTIICFIVAEVFISIINVLFVLGFKSKKLFLPDFFPSAITEDITLENAVPLFVHYHGTIYSCRDKNFENYYGSFGVLYYECINSPFVLYKFYL